MSLAVEVEVNVEIRNCFRGRISRLKLKLKLKCAIEAEVQHSDPVSARIIGL